MFKTGNQLVAVKEIVENSLAAIIRERSALARVLVIPVALKLAISAALAMKPTITASIILIIPWIMVHTVFAIAIHRVILLGPESISRGGIYVWTERETRFAVRLAALIILVVIIFFSPLALGFLALPFLFFVLALAAPRLALVFPAIATGKTLEFNTAWDLSKDYWLTLFLIGIFIPILILLPNSILQELPYGSSIANVYGIFSSIFFVVCYSLAFRHVTAAKNMPRDPQERQ